MYYPEPQEKSREFTQEQARQWHQAKKDETNQYIQKRLSQIPGLIGSDNGMERFLNIQLRLLRESSQNAMLIYFGDKKATEVKTAKEWEDLGGTVVKNTKRGQSTATKAFRETAREKADGTKWKDLMDLYDIRYVRGVQSVAPSQRKTSWNDLKIYMSRIINGLKNMSIVVVTDNTTMPGRIHYNNDTMTLYADFSSQNNTERAFHQLIQEVAFAKIAWLLRQDGPGADEKMPEYNANIFKNDVQCVEYMVCQHLGLATDQINLATATTVYQKLTPNELISRFSYVKRVARSIIKDMEEEQTEKGDDQD